MNNKIDLDEILDAFGAAAARPTEALLREWIKKYPQLEHDLVEFATAWAATMDLPTEDLDSQLEDELVNHTMSRVQILDRELDEQKQIAAPAAMARLQIDSLEQALRERGVSSSWVDAFGIDDSILVLLDEHMIASPVPRRLVDTFSRALGVHVEVFSAWLFQDSRPQMVSYAAKTPTFERWTFQQAVEKSSLPDALKQQWLNETADS